MADPNAPVVVLFSHAHAKNPQGVEVVTERSRRSQNRISVVASEMIEKDMADLIAPESLSLGADPLKMEDARSSNDALKKLKVKYENANVKGMDNLPIVSTEIFEVLIAKRRTHGKLNNIIRNIIVADNLAREVEQEEHKIILAGMGNAHEEDPNKDFGEGGHPYPFSEAIAREGLNVIVIEMTK